MPGRQHRMCCQAQSPLRRCRELPLARRTGVRPICHLVPTLRSRATGVIRDPDAEQTRQMLLSGVARAAPGPAARLLHSRATLAAEREPAAWQYQRTQLMWATAARLAL